MKLLFAKKATEGIPVSDSCGNQRVAASLQDGLTIYVLVVDFKENKYYIERVKDKNSADAYRSSNFEVISNQEFVACHSFLTNNGIIPKQGY